MKKIIYFVFLFLLVFLFGFFLGNKSGLLQKSGVPESISKGQENTFQAGWDAAKARLKQSSYGIAIPDGMEIKNVSGTIQKIAGNKLTVKIINSLDPLSDPDLDTRIITVDANTKISLAVQKDPVQWQKEMQDFQDKIQQQPTQTDPAQAPTPILPPIPFDTKDIKVADLKENQQVSVTANEDIKDKKEFTAVQIDAQEIGIQSAP